MDIYNAMSVITKTGDKGETKLFSQVKGQHRMVDKDSQIVWVIGTLDELNSYLGLIKVDYQEPELIEDIQTNLFTASSVISGANVEFDSVIIKEIEETVAKVEGMLPKISNFVYSGSNQLSASLHFARSLSRRAEREAVALNKLQKVPEDILIFLNRLSDFLFILMRLEVYKTGSPEKIWKPIRKLTQLPELVTLPSGIQGYKRTEIMDWLKANGEAEDDFYKDSVRMTAHEGDFVILKDDVEAFVIKLK